MMLEELSLLVSARSVLFQSWRFDLLLSIEAIEAIWSNASNPVGGLICFVVLQALPTRSSIMYIRYLYWCSCQTQRLDCSYKLTWQLVTTSMISDPECATLHFEMPSFHSAKTCKTYSEEIKNLWSNLSRTEPVSYCQWESQPIRQSKTWEGWRISSSFRWYGSPRPGGIARGGVFGALWRRYFDVFCPDAAISCRASDILSVVPWLRS